MAKFTNFFIVVVVFIIAIPSTVLGQEMTKKEKNTIVGYRTVHFINLKTVEDEAKFALIADVFNKLVAELGYQNVHYNFWKVTGDREGQYNYIFESTWPDQETFDKVHEYEKFKVTKQKWYPKFKEMIASPN